MNAKTRYIDPQRQLRKLVRIHLEKSGQTPAAFSKAAGVHRSRFHHFYRDKEDIGMSQFMRLCRYLRIDLAFAERFRVTLDGIVREMCSLFSLNIRLRDIPSRTTDDPQEIYKGIVDRGLVAQIVKDKIPKYRNEFDYLWDMNCEVFEAAFREVEGDTFVEYESESRAIYIYLENQLSAWYDANIEKFLKKPSKG